jgi:hypothetical protein
MRINRPILVLAAVVAAVLVDLAIFAIAGMAGASLRFPGADGAELSPLVVAGMSAVPLGLALALAAVLAPRLPWVVPAGLVAAPVLLLGSIPLMPLQVGFDAGTTVALSLMHVALVPIAVLALLGLRRYSPAVSRSTIGSSARA